MTDTISANKTIYACSATLMYSNPTSFTFTFVLEILTNLQIEDSNPGLLNNSETGFSAKFFCSQYFSWFRNLSTNVCLPWPSSFAPLGLSRVQKERERRRLMRDKKKARAPAKGRFQSKQAKAFPISLSSQREWNMIKIED